MCVCVCCKITGKHGNLLWTLSGHMPPKRLVLTVISDAISVVVANVSGPDVRDKHAIKLSLSRTRNELRVFRVCRTGSPMELCKFRRLTSRCPSNKILPTICYFGSYAFIDLCTSDKIY